MKYIFTLLNIIYWELRIFTKHSRDTLKYFEWCTKRQNKLNLFTLECHVAHFHCCSLDYV